MYVYHVYTHHDAIPFQMLASDKDEAIALTLLIAEGAYYSQGILRFGRKLEKPYAIVASRKSTDRNLAQYRRDEALKVKGGK